MHKWNSVYKGVFRDYYLLTNVFFCIDVSATLQENYPRQSSSFLPFLYVFLCLLEFLVSFLISWVFFFSWIAPFFSFLKPFAFISVFLSFCHAFLPVSFPFFFFSSLSSNHLWLSLCTGRWGQNDSTETRYSDRHSSSSLIICRVKSVHRHTLSIGCSWEQLNSADFHHACAEQGNSDRVAFSAAIIISCVKSDHRLDSTSSNTRHQIHDWVGVMSDYLSLTMTCCVHLPVVLWRTVLCRNGSRRSHSEVELQSKTYFPTNQFYATRREHETGWPNFVHIECEEGCLLDYDVSLWSKH